MIQIINGDCRDVLKTLPDNSVQCVVTSPPYFGLRDYNCAGQIGLEKTPDAYVAEIVAVFREVKRVLREDGTVFLNLGDSYSGAGAGGGGNRKGNEHGQHDVMVGQGIRGKVPDGLKPKDLMMIPARVALALQGDGWWLRSDIIWAKGCSGLYRGGNVMPESVTDRPTRAHEYLFLLTKRERYFYDSQAIKEPIQESSIARISQSNFANQTGGDKDYGVNQINASRSMRKTLENFAENQSGGRNIRTVWTVNTESFSGAHFATMPSKLVEPCILAGTSEKGCCSECGAPWQRVIDADAYKARTGGRKYAEESGHNNPTGKVPESNTRGMPDRHKRTTGWKPTCTCNAPVKPCVVLDPFGGSGTVGMVAEKLGRDAILIELNPDYIELAKQRTAQPGFSFLEAA